MFKRTIISASLLLASNLMVSAATEANKEAIQELIEQEFQTIDLDEEEVDEEDSDGKFEFQDEATRNSKTKQISIKNEFYESVKVVLSSLDDKAPIQNQEVYLNAYETNDSILISKGVQYEVEVYNLYNEYLGYIYKANTKSRNKVAISPFLLIKDKPAEKKPVFVNQEVKKQEITIELAPIKVEEKKVEKLIEQKIEEKKAEEQKPVTEKVIVKETKTSSEDSSSGFRSITESSNYSHEIITHKETEETKIFREEKEEVKEEVSKQPIKEPELSKEAPSPKDITISETSSSTASKVQINTSNTKVRNIKVANISDDEIRINLVDPLGNPIGGGWTISNDVYVPQFLNFQSEPIHIEPNVKLLINNSKSKEIITKFAKDLNIDEKGNYVWFVD